VIEEPEPKVKITVISKQKEARIFITKYPLSVTVEKLKEEIRERFSWWGVPLCNIILVDSEKLYSPEKLSDQIEKKKDSPVLYAWSVADSNLTSLHVYRKNPIIHFADIQPYYYNGPQIPTDCIVILDTNVFAVSRHVRSLFVNEKMKENKVQDFTLATTLTVESEFKNLVEHKKAKGKIDTIILATPEFTTPRQQSIFSAVYKSLYRGRWTKLGTQWPQSLDDVWFTQHKSFVDSAKNDLTIWLECAVLARRYGKRVCLLTLDSDFEAFLNPSAQVLKDLSLYFQPEDLKAIPIIRGFQADLQKYMMNQMLPFGLGSLSLASSGPPSLPPTSTAQAEQETEM